MRHKFNAIKPYTAILDTFLFIRRGGATTIRPHHANNMKKKVIVHTEIRGKQQQKKNTIPRIGRMTNVKQATTTKTHTKNTIQTRNRINRMKLRVTCSYLATLKCVWHSHGFLYRFDFQQNRSINKQMFLSWHNRIQMKWLAKTFNG